MTGKKTSVRVTIAGEEYTLRTETTPEHARAVAAHVDQVIKTVLNSGPVVETHRAAILAALQITGELFRLREAREEVATRVEELMADVRRWLPPAKRGGEEAKPAASP
ncbi:MAG TPA: cell division protein ZapA [Gemmatimonadaceae bacterium]|nr:cell division protein ZapA [Gemmatimonadaceae bacterium]